MCVGDNPARTGTHSGTSETVVDLEGQLDLVVDLVAHIVDVNIHRAEDQTFQESGLRV